MMVMMKTIMVINDDGDEDEDEGEDNGDDDNDGDDKFQRQTYQFVH